MKGILLALVAFSFLSLTSIVAVRLYSGKKYFKPLLGASCLSALFYTFLFYAMPADLGWLGPAWMVDSPHLDFGNGLLILFLLFHSFWDAVYTSFFTGFSSGILMRCLQKGEAGLTLEELIQMYQNKQLSNPVIDVRLQNLIQGRYLTAETPAHYQLLPKGDFFATLAQAVQRWLHMGEGG